MPSSASGILRRRRRGRRPWLLAAGAAGFGGGGLALFAPAFASGRGGNTALPASTNHTNGVDDADRDGKHEVYLSQVENILLGAAAGVIKTYLLMPLATLKYCLQEGRALPRSPFEWYRGVLPNAAFMVPITAAQIWANGVIEKFVSRNGTRTLTPYEKVGCAVAAGAFSALLYAPLDLVVIQQQKLKLNLLATVNHIREEYGHMRFMRGLRACMVREAVYTGGYLGLAPVLSAALKASGPSLFHTNDFLAGLAGSVIAGVAASLVTHPVDTAKTNIQADIAGIQYAGTRQAIVDIVEETGLASLYKGGVARCTQVSSSVFVLSSIRAKALELKRESIEQNQE